MVLYTEMLGNCYAERLDASEDKIPEKCSEMVSQMVDLSLNNYISLIFDTFMELRGDRKSGDDEFVTGGLARLGEYKVIVIGYGGDSSDEAPGIPGPAGYRKCSRLIHLAEDFGKPVIVLIDVPAAKPLPVLEQQRIDEAIARSLEEMSCLKTPTIGVVTGEFSASIFIDMCAVDRVLMLEGGGFSVASSDESAASNTDANALRLNIKDLLDLKVVHKVVKASPEGNLESAAIALKETMLEELRQLSQICPETLVRQRLDRLQHQFANFGDAGLTSDKIDNIT